MKLRISENYKINKNKNSNNGKKFEEKKGSHENQEKTFSINERDNYLSLSSEETSNIDEEQ